MRLRGLWAAAQRWYAAHSSRDRRVLLGVVVAAFASLVYVGVIDPLRTYRRHVAEEIVDGQEELERSARFLAAADSLRTERDQLRKRLEDARSRLLPGDSGTLGAAALQERANSLAAAHNITVQSTQVMREEVADPFRKVSVRLTLSGELKPFAEYVSALEYGPQQLNIPFVEVSRRGAVAGAKGPRTLSATVELSGYLKGAEKGAKPEGEPAVVEGEPAAVEGEPLPAPAEGEGAPAAPGATAPGAVAAPAAVAPAAAVAPVPIAGAPALGPAAAPGPTALPAAAPPAATAGAAAAAPGAPPPAAAPAATPVVPPAPPAAAPAAPPVPAVPAPQAGAGAPAAPQNSVAAVPAHPDEVD